MGKIIEFDGGYGRTGTIQVMAATCCSCNGRKLCIVVDQSQGEYEAGAICNDCIAETFKGEPRFFSIVGSTATSSGVAVFLDKDGKEVGRITNIGE